MPSIELRNLRNFILNGINLRIEDGEILCILGRNGAGKTTLLKAVAGLVKYTGNVLFDGIPIDGLPPEKRDIGYVPQTLALFPHMTVEENIAYGLKARRLPKALVEKRVEEMLDLLDLKHLRRRYPRTLSGGEKQRVAIARALAIKPRVLLLDEPFTSIQPSIRYTLIGEVEKLVRDLHLTVLYTSHDAEEIEKLGYRIAVLNNGSLVAVGSLSEIITVISEVFQELNTLECTVVSEAGKGLVKVKCGDLVVVAPMDKPVNVGDEVFLVIPPSGVIVLEEPLPFGVNVFKARVVEVNAEYNRILLSLNGILLKAYTPGSPYVKENTDVYVKLPLKHLDLVI